MKMFPLILVNALVCCVVLLSGANNAFAQGWNDARFGMNVQEVQKAYPKARLLKETSRKKFNCRLQLDGLQIGADEYTVRFYFDPEDRLSQVGITMADSVKVDVISQIATETLRDKLTEKYGAPTSTNKELNERSWLWLKEGLVVKLEYVPSTCFVGVFYSKPDEDAQKKL
jgi:hypothetical protein